MTQREQAKTIIDQLSDARIEIIHEITILKKAEKFIRKLPKQEQKRI